MSTKDATRGEIVGIPGDAPRILIVRAPYYRNVVDGLTAGARAVLSEAGAAIETIDVAGAFELPQAIRFAARAGGHDGYVALGCVVRGETSHYDHICDATMTGLMDVALQFGLALGTGLLTVETIAQAEARSSTEGGANKGEEAAIACLRQVALLRHFSALPPHAERG